MWCSKTKNKSECRCGRNILAARWISSNPFWRDPTSSARRDQRSAMSVPGATTRTSWPIGPPRTDPFPKGDLNGYDGSFWPLGTSMRRRQFITLLWLRCGGLAACGARAAGDDAGNRISQPGIARPGGRRFAGLLVGLGETFYHRFAPAADRAA